jgi:uncharacterized protein (DUF433 family)
MGDAAGTTTAAVDAPAYTVADAARFLHLPYGTLRYWVRGKDSHAPVIPADAGDYLSFRNLVEAHVLRGLRRRKDFSLPEIRRIVAALAGALHVERPLAHPDLRLYGDRILFEHGGVLIEAAPMGQVVMRDVFKAHLERIDFERDIAVTLYPFARVHAGLPDASEPKIVRIDPRVQYGRPFVDPAIRTEVISSRFEAGDSIAELAEDYGCSSGQIEEAVRYEYVARHYKEAA